MYRLTSLKRSVFLRNAATLMSGTVLAQALPILCAPVIARLYGPTDYGVLGVYMVITGIVGIFATSQYNHAIMLPETDRESANLVGTCVLLTLLISFGTLLVLAGLEAWKGAAFWPYGLGHWIYFVPVSVGSAGLYATLSCWTTRKSKFRRVAFSRIVQSISVLCVQIALGVLGGGPRGLLLGLITGQVVAVVVLAAQVVADDAKVFLSNVRVGEIRQAVARHRAFAYYLLPGDLMTSFSQQIPTIMLARFWGPAEVGNFNYTQRLLGMPISLIATSVLEVFKQRAVSDYNTTGNCGEIFWKTFKSLAGLGLLPTVAIVMAAPWLFSTVFGARWAGAGGYAQLMAGMFYFRFVVTPLSYTYYIARRQREDLLTQTLIVIGGIAALAAGYYVGGSAAAAVLTYSLNYMVCYALVFFRSLAFSRGAASAPRYSRA